jgi:AcrR family transcriptional regulator
MAALLAERNLDAITVRALAAKAEIGYATFFRHYTDKEALLADMADVLIVEFLQQVRPLLEQKDRLGAARTLCAFVNDRLPIYQTLIAGGAGDTVRAEMLRQSMDIVARSRRRKPEGPLDDLILFHIVSSILNLLAWWLRHLDEVDWETMAEIIERVVLTPVSALRGQPAPGPAGLEPAAD